MTVRVERSVVVPASPERVWAFIGDPDARAEHISVVDDWDVHGDDAATWHVSLPVPFVDRTVSVETRDVERRPPEFVAFRGKSKVLRVTGEHELEAVDEGTRLTSSFVVDGRIPGVERFFEKNLDAELERLERALRADLEADRTR